MDLNDLNWNTAFNIWVKAQGYLGELEKIIPLIPGAEDTKWQKVTKLMSLGNKVQEKIFPGRSADEEIDLYVEQKGLKESHDASFIKMVASSPLRFDFSEDIICINQFKGPRGATLYKYTSNHGSFYTIYSLEKLSKGDAELHWFLYEERFDQEKVICSLWDKYNNCISVEGRGINFSFSAVPKITDPISKSAKKRVEELGKRYRSYQESKVPRTVMLVGPPGCGKTTAVLRLGEKLGGKVIRIESTSLGQFKPSEIRNFLSGLKPTCIIVDDIDRVDWREKSHILTILEYIKMDNEDAVLLLTANRISVLDPAFVRPGRIDEIQWYKLPNNVERRELFEVYMEDLGVNIPKSVLNKLVEMSRGLTGAWIKELILQIKHSPDDDIFQSIESMIKLKGSVGYVYPDDINPDVDEEEYEDDEDEDQIQEDDEEEEKLTFDDMIDEMNHKEIMAFLKACKNSDRDAQKFLKKKLLTRA